VGVKDDTLPGDGHAPPPHETETPPSSFVTKATPPPASARTGRVPESVLAVADPSVTAPPQPHPTRTATQTHVAENTRAITGSSLSVPRGGALGHRPRFMNARLAFLVAAVPVAMACGGRTQLPDLEHDAGATAPDAPSAVAPGSLCATDADCPVTRFCTASAHCDPATGCSFAPRSCDDGVDCTRDECSEVERRCIHTPSDSLCPTTQLCSPKRGCDAFVYSVASDGHLYETRVPSGTLVDLGAPAASLSDVALGSNGVLYATDSYVLYGVDRASGTATTIASILPLHLYNGLGTANASLLATADVPQLFGIDPIYGSSISRATLPSGYRASGDITALGTRVLIAAASTANPSTDTLIEVNLSTGASNVLGNFGYRCVWGLATLGAVVYGLTCEGRILTVDATTGAATEIASTAPAFFGAAGR
jgi:hypothetical protein